MWLCEKMVKKSGWGYWVIGCCKWDEQKFVNEENKRNKSFAWKLSSMGFG